MPTPAISPVHAVLDRQGLVKRRTRRRNKALGTALFRPAQPKDLWCADDKGEFASDLKAGDRQAGRTFLQLQAKFDDFIDCYNNERPHQALNMHYPVVSAFAAAIPGGARPRLLLPRQGNHGHDLRPHLLTDHGRSMVIDAPKTQIEPLSGRRLGPITLTCFS